MKKSFAMLVAIGFIVVMATVASLMLVFSAETMRQTEDNYLNSQGEMYAKSAVEFAIQVLESRDFEDYGCVDNVDVNTSLYDINMTFHYFFKGCPTDCANCTEITTKESNGTVMINVYVKSKVNNVRFFKQTLQKF